MVGAVQDLYWVAVRVRGFFFGIIMRVRGFWW
jgi:hypothetical protein